MMGGRRDGDWGQAGRDGMVAVKWQEASRRSLDLPVVFINN